MPGTNPKIGGGGFHHVAMRVKDFDKSLKFYRDGLGFVQKAAWGTKPNRTVLLDTGDGNYFEIFEGKPDQTAQEGIFLHIALRTDNCDSAVESARSAGAEVTMEPRDIDLKDATPPLKMRIAFIKGPDGETLEFFQSEDT